MNIACWLLLLIIFKPFQGAFCPISDSEIVCRHVYRKIVLNTGKSLEILGLFVVFFVITFVWFFYFSAWGNPKQFLPFPNMILVDLGVGFNFPTYKWKNNFIHGQIFGDLSFVIFLLLLFLWFCNFFGLRSPKTNFFGPDIGICVAKIVHLTRSMNMACWLLLRIIL